MLPMTKTILMNLIKGPATRPHPFVRRESFDRVRGNLVNDITVCILCGICQRTCPSLCLEVNKEDRTWRYEPFACVFCGLCVEKCPVNSLSMENLYRSPVGEREVVILTGPPEEKEE